MHDTSSFEYRAKSFFRKRGCDVVPFEQLKSYQKWEGEAKYYLNQAVVLQERMRFLERKFLKKFSPSRLLGIVYEEDCCPFYSVHTAMPSQPDLPKGTCMKYGSYGHIELGLPWGMPLCTLRDADSCPIFNHDVPYTYGVEDGNLPYGSIWWPNINGNSERITDWRKQVYGAIWTWLEDSGKIEIKKEGE